MTAPRHLMILASAGSGKTYALTGRFVRLLAEGAPPERIVALTFTRKAAGEFFDEILKKLGAAAADADRARQLAAEIGRPELGRAHFLGLLRGVTEAMPRLRLGTLDSFFARIARSFPMELGLAGEFELLDPQEEKTERTRVLRRMFARSGGLSEAQRDFIEAFKRATFGRDEKNLAAQLDGFLTQHQGIYFAAPESGRWGDPARIWPQGNAWLAARPDRSQAAGALRTWLAVAAPGEKQRKRWEDFLAALDSWAPGATPGRELSYLLEKALGAWEEVCTGRVTLEFDRKKQELDAPACAALSALVVFVAGGELARRLETTRGIHGVLRHYEQTYDALVRRAGRLTFADVQRLLAPEAGAPALSGEPGADRLFIDYRLDAEIDHWLLDEFQDTSFGQWSVLRNLIDEVVQDPSGRRSFFCVGDTKQAIYSWREGDPRLFREILRHYTAAAPGAIATGHLDESWRSGPAIIALVNRVFGNAEAMRGLFPGPMSDAWSAEWRDHVSAVPQRAGQAAWLLAEDEAGRRDLAVRLLRELRPLERGLTCAVLVQTNRAAAETAEHLRQAGGLPAVAESDLPVCTDNPLGAALLALVQAAGHPGDTLAWEHVRMTPLVRVLEVQGIRNRDQLCRRLLGQIHEGGFESAMAYWVREVLPFLAPEDAFTRERARQWLDAARAFDADGSRDIAEFVAFMARHTVREPEGAAVIRVMTIHKAKGLGFDVVILPDLEGTRLDQARGGLAVHKAPDRSVEWVLDPPPKLLAQHDAVLAAHLREAEAEAGYEALSLFYVALTRAKRGLYVITAAPDESTSRNYPRLLGATLGEAEREAVVGTLRVRAVWEQGEPTWHEGMRVEAAAPQGGPSRIAGSRRVGRRFPGRQPSLQGGEGVLARLFSLDRGAAADFGSAVHEYLGEVEWGPADEVRRDWQTRNGAGEAAAMAAAVVAAPTLREVWARPADSDRFEVWRERSFEMIWDEEWVTGTMDRVVVERAGPAGEPVRATVYDFKTDMVSEKGLADAAGRHRDQMRLYRQAVARLTGLPLSQVRGVLVFTRLLVQLDVSS